MSLAYGDARILAFETMERWIGKLYALRLVRLDDKIHQQSTLQIDDLWSGLYNGVLSS